jgi:uncharacterized membrane protein
MALPRKHVLLSALLLAAVPALADDARRHAGHYEAVDLGTFGGNYSYGYGINELGWIAGGAATEAETNGIAEKGFVWFGFGPLIETGTLGGRDCPDCSSEAGGPNFWGESALISETAKSDPNNEDFCGFGTHRQCLGAVWREWRLTALTPFPGGHNSQAYWLNDYGQVAGIAETKDKDATCSTGKANQVLRFEAAIWGRSGEIHELRPLEGDTVGFAFGINNRGQAVGTSGQCSNVTVPDTGRPAGPHAVLWEPDGRPVNLGTLGGTYNLASSINDEGDVTGNAQSSKDGNIHPFLWSREDGIQDLGAYQASILTVAPCCHSLNNRRQIAGFAIDSNFNIRALLWEHGAYTDLNELVPSGSPLYLQQATSINDAGQITGFGLVKSACAPQTPPAWLVNQRACPLVHAFVLRPSE